jgi:hypothetical protein
MTGPNSALPTGVRNLTIRSISRPISGLNLKKNNDAMTTQASGHALARFETNPVMVSNQCTIQSVSTTGEKASIMTIEYKVRVSITGGEADAEQICNRLAEKGWRLVSTAEASQGISVTLFLFFERELEARN